MIFAAVTAATLSAINGTILSSGNWDAAARAAYQAQLQAEMEAMKVRSMMNAWCPKLFPRDEVKKVERMTKYAEWKRRQIRDKHWQIATLTAAWMLGIPVGVAIIAMAWRLCLMVILQ